MLCKAFFLTPMQPQEVYKGEYSKKATESFLFSGKSVRDKVREEIIRLKFSASFIRGRKNWEDSGGISLLPDVKALHLLPNFYGKRIRFLADGSFRKRLPHSFDGKGASPENFYRPLLS